MRVYLCARLVLGFCKFGFASVGFFMGFLNLRTSFLRLKNTASILLDSGWVRGSAHYARFSIAPTTVGYKYGR